MNYSCKLCDKSMTNKSKYSQLKSIGHKILDESIIRRYSVLNPNNNQIDAIMKKHINGSNMKDERCSVDCVLKLITTTNRVRYIRISTRPNLDYFLNFSKNSILSKKNQDHYCFSHVYEKRITFSSSFRDMTYDNYLKQRMPMCEVKLNQIVAKHPRLIYRLNRFSTNPYIRKYTIQEMIFANERN